VTSIECLAWSAVVVTAVAAGAWLVGLISKRLGIELGFAPAWAVLASIPLVTAASLTPAVSLWRSGPSVDSAPGSDGEFSLLSLADALNAPTTKPLLSEEEARRPIRSDVATPGQAGIAPWNWTAIGARIEPWFRAAAPWLAGIMAVSLVAGWLRLLIGWNAIQRIAAGSRPIADSDLHEQFDVLRAELSVTFAVDLRECPGLSSPAAFGWRHPTVLLPTEWPQWSADERRAVLAHELAHVRRRDYLAWMVAQACAAAHLFNPFVRGVSQWLRLEQECSADADAARVAGGRGEYLRVLANLAVRQRDVSSAWPARCFLPTRGSFLRRIEMLRSRPPRWSVRTAAGNAALTACIAAAGLTLSAFRPALATPNTAFQEGDKASTASVFPIPQTAIAAGQIRVADGIKHPQLGKFLADFVRSAPVFRHGSPLKVEDVERLGLIVLATDGRDGGAGFDGAIVLVGRTPWDAKRLHPDGKEIRTTTEAGVTVFRDGENILALQLDPRTLIVPETDRMSEKVLRAMTGPRHERLEKMLAGGAEATISFATSGSEFFGEIVSNPNPGDQMFANLAKPMVVGQQSMLLEFVADADLRVSVKAEYSTAEGAQTAAKTAEAALVLLGNLAGTAAAGVPSNDPKSQLLKGVKTALASAKVEAAGDKASATVQVKNAAFASLLAKMAAEGTASNSRNVSMNNLKQIALAMHLYHDAFKSFPAAAASEKDGKFPVSWRVRVLPYIEHQALYREYRMNEPWDSEHNKKLLAKMPRIYRSPSKPSATETPYQVLVGSDTIFPPDRGVALDEVRDGVSNTILVVEADKTVPWTKPEDVSFPFSGSPPLGGSHEGAILAAFGDGSVQFLPKALDRAALDARITRNGREVIGDAAVPSPHK
jgi:beta-lactamase regulating signal transducer with metallopeptidase domain